MGNERPIKVDYNDAWSGPTGYVSLRGIARNNAENITANRGRPVEFVVRRESYGGVALVFVQRLLAAEAAEQAESAGRQLTASFQKFTRQECVERFLDAVLELPDVLFDGR
jgi:hypothetical protein